MADVGVRKAGLLLLLLLGVLRGEEGEGEGEGRVRCLLGEGLEDSMNFLRHGHQHELKLCLRPDHVRALVADVLQRGGNVDLLSALCHAIQDHVDEAVGPSASYAVAAEG